MQNCEIPVRVNGLAGFCAKTSSKFFCKKLAKNRERVNSSLGTCDVFAENSYRRQNFSLLQYRGNEKQRYV